MANRSQGRRGMNEFPGQERELSDSPKGSSRSKGSVSKVRQRQGARVQVELIDVATADVANQTRRILVGAFYQMMLRALQSEAARLDYHFVVGSERPALPDELMRALGRAVVRARSQDIEPLLSGERLQSYLEDSEVTGYTTAWAAALLKALAEQGIFLSAGPNAPGLLKALVAEREVVKISGWGEGDDELLLVSAMSELGEGNAFARAIYEKAEELAPGKLPYKALYPTLARLEQRQWISSREVDLRVYYELQEAGRLAACPECFRDAEGKQGLRRPV